MDNPLPVPSRIRRVATNLNQSRRGVPSSGRQRSDGSRKIDQDHASRSIDLRGYSWRVFRGVFPRWKRFSGTLSMGNCLAMGPIRQEMMKCFAIVPAFFSGSNVKAVGLDFWIESERRAPAWGIQRPCRGARWGGGGDRRFRCASTAGSYPGSLRLPLPMGARAVRRRISAANSKD